MAQIPVIKQDELIDITVNGSFYARVQQLALFLLRDKEQAQVIEIFDKIANNKIEDEVTAHVQTMVVLMNEIERSAQENNKIQMEESDNLNIEA